MSKIRRYFARRFLYLRLLRFSLVAGSLANLAVAVFLAAYPDRLPLTLGMAQYAAGRWLLAIAAVMLAGLYVIAARDPRRYSAIILTAILGRLATGAALVAIAYLTVNPDGLGIWGIGEMVLALAHAGFWYPVYK